jgi:hypothetical protein
MDYPNEWNLIPYDFSLNELNKLIEWESQRLASLFGSLEHPSDLEEGVLPFLGTSGMMSPVAVKQRSRLYKEISGNKTPRLLDTRESVTELESLYRCWGLVPRHVRE